MKIIAHPVTPITALLLTLVFAGSLGAEDFTLSDNAMMTMLNEINSYNISKSSIVEKRDINEPGVEFDIYFPGTKPGERSFELVATKQHDPNNPLFASDVRVFDAFALKFTLLAVDGDPSPSHKGRLVVGAYINRAYRPKSVTLDPEQTNTAISRTRVGPDNMNTIGIKMHMPSPEEWDPNGTTITLLVEPVPRAVVIPRTPKPRPRSNSGKVIYVDADATGSNDGSSWANAFTFLQNAIFISSKGDEIWVARGIYKPNKGRLLFGPTFALKSGVAIYGGFPSGGGSWEDSNPLVNETILSGDLRVEDAKVNNPTMLLTDPTRSDNADHVVTASGADETAVLDGFIIMGGNTGGSNVSNQGGGLYGKIGSPTISNCIFKLNSAELGGAVHFWRGNPQFINCRFIDNYAGDSGGAMHNAECNPVLVNCIFTKNSANEKGGAIYNESNRTDIINCTIMNNHAYAGGGIYNQKSKPILTNCILWGNTSRYDADEPAQLYGVKVEASHCCIQGLTPQLGGKNCFAKDPLITDIDADTYHLSVGSPCIDAGDSKTALNTIKTDIDGNPRIAGTAVDIGAVEAH